MNDSILLAIVKGNVPYCKATVREYEGGGRALFISYFQRRGVVQITSIQKCENIRNFVTVVRKIRIFISKYENVECQVCITPVLTCPPVCPQVELQYLAIGESAFPLTSDFLSLQVSLHPLTSLPPVDMSGLVFQLPDNLYDFLTSPDTSDTGPVFGGLDTDLCGLTSQGNGTLDSGQVMDADFDYRCRCVQTRAMSFLHNPFTYLHTPADLQVSGFDSSHG